MTRGVRIIEGPLYIDGRLEYVKTNYGLFWNYYVLQGGLQAVHVATIKGHTELVEHFLDEEGVSPRIQVEVNNERQLR